MDRRDILRKEVVALENITGVKRVIKRLNSVSDCQIAIKQIYEEFFRRKETNEKEKLYERISELSEKIKSFELEIKTYKHKKEKYSKELLELRQEKSITLKNKKISDETITNLTEENNKFKESTIKLQRQIIELKEKIETLRKENIELIDINNSLDFEIKKRTEEKDSLLKENDDLRYELLKKKPSLLERIFKF